MSFSIACGTPLDVKPSQTKIVSYSLFPGNTQSMEGYVIARAGINNNGPVRIRLLDENGNALSGYVDSYSSSASKLKLVDVSVVNNDRTPMVIQVEVVNQSTASHSYATVYDILLLLTS